MGDKILNTRRIFPALLVLCIFAFFLQFSSAISCDSGDISTTCYISGTYNFADGETVTANNLVIQNGGLINNTAYVSNHGSKIIFSLTGNLTIESGGEIKGGNITITAANVNVNNGGSISSDYLGYQTGYGPGVGAAGDAFNAGAGGGYGGTGGDASYYRDYHGLPGSGRDGGDSYGSLYFPSDFGSGGGYSNNDAARRKYGGGGTIRINASNQFIINGLISSSGNNGYATSTNDWYAAGGGSGGSIWITASGASGSGNISADGGNGWDAIIEGGGGSGGRIAIYTNTNSFSGSGTITAYGGVGPFLGSEGAAGTIFINTSLSTYGKLIIDNNGLFSYEGTQMGPGIFKFDNLTLFNRGVLEIKDKTTQLNLNETVVSADGDFYTRIVNHGNISITPNYTIDAWTLEQNNGTNLFNLENLTLINGAYLTHTMNYYRLAADFNYYLDLNLSNIYIDATSGINVDGMGYGTGYGPGAGRNGIANNGAGGGAYGGPGGNGESGYEGGSSSGVYLEPVFPGSGGGYALVNSGLRRLGKGGGIIKINLSGFAIVNGDVSSSGEDGYSWDNSYTGGGGSGGSIWLIANTITGTGNLKALGGSGADRVNADGGGGSGGRISVFYNTLDIPITKILATGGTGPGAATDGVEGTVYLINQEPSTIVFHNNTPENNSGTAATFEMNASIETYDVRPLLEVKSFWNGSETISYEDYPKLWLNLNNLSSLNEKEGRLIDNSPHENHAGAGREYHMVENFDLWDWVNEWTSSSLDDEKLIGLEYYNISLTSTTNNYIQQDVADFSTEYDHFEIGYKSYSGGPYTIKIYYTDNADCASFSDTCSQIFTINASEGWHIFEGEITDAEWIDDDGNIDDLQIYFNDASSTGEYLLDHISFFKENESTRPSITEGRYGKGLSFDGIDDVVYIEDDDSLDSITSDFAIMGWVKTNQTGISPLFSKRNDSDGYEVYLQDGYLMVAFERLGSVRTTDLGTKQINDDSWHHVSIAFNREGSVVRYIDGVGEGVNKDLTPNSIQNNSEPLLIGKNSTGDGYFNGLIDEVLIFNKTLTPAQITDLYYANLFRANKTLWYFYRNQTGMSPDEEYDYYVSVKDAGNVYNKSETRIALGNLVITINGISNDPSSYLALDPNITITVTANISDIDNNYDHAILQWKNSSDAWSVASNNSMSTLA